MNHWIENKIWKNEIKQTEEKIVHFFIVMLSILINIIVVVVDVGVVTTVFLFFFNALLQVHYENSSLAYVTASYLEQSREPQQKRKGSGYYLTCYSSDSDNHRYAQFIISQNEIISIYFPLILQTIIHIVNMFAFFA